MKYLAKFENPFHPEFPLEVYEKSLKFIYGSKSEVYWSMGNYIYKNKERVNQLFNNISILEKILGLASIENEPSS